MWCLKCQADVAAEMAPDNRRVLCASCGSPIRSVPVSPTEDKTRQARELLERWSKNRWSEDSEETTEPEMESEPETAASTRPGAPAIPVPRAQTAIRRDFSHDPSPRIPSLQPAAAAPEVSPGFPSMQRTDDRHGFSAPSPHFPGEPFSLEDEAPAKSTSSRLQTFWGQILAYAGVLALTIGAAFVLLGYFGGPEWQSYTPTGWLITTTGQMLLFLGVVTLVSGGMEQTTEEVARRIDRLGQRMIRIEWASQNHALKGPSIPAEHFAADRERQSDKASRESAFESLMDDARR